ncbi:uncharacterized protein CC84DRAFT_743562 [Paraphaeosphaeria sporulosa]|uniref:Uncharacterized protein n=1 Tax=Paraphaeosphaeria sporulosa TaxID=1460663 RepID=A0A177CGQ1_9PLEO|nr:uncharacterized protein CC84DRAFT_743562 [Paraphaeosphaeria sporulosa]OAG06028.1 hypothetical protein CC84DRAFT_743562 [Paraphaeosphaeria sporulosa]
MMSIALISMSPHFTIDTAASRADALLAELPVMRTSCSGAIRQPSFRAVNGCLLQYYTHVAMMCDLRFLRHWTHTGHVIVHLQDRPPRRHQELELFLLEIWLFESCGTHVYGIV